MPTISIHSATFTSERPDVGRLVRVEQHHMNGLPSYTIIGLPDNVYRASRERVQSALLSSGLSWPMRRVTINLAPAAHRVGQSLDLAIALGMMALTGEIAPARLEGVGALGALGLDGAVRPLPNIAPLVAALSDNPDIHTILVPHENFEESLGFNGVVAVALSLRQICRAMRRGRWVV